jgi:hypothetical protein
MTPKLQAPVGCVEARATHRTHEIWRHGKKFSSPGFLLNLSKSEDFYKIGQKYDTSQADLRTFVWLFLTVKTECVLRPERTDA